MSWLNESHQKIKYIKNEFKNKKKFQGPSLKKKKNCLKLHTLINFVCFIIFISTKFIYHTLEFY